MMFINVLHSRSKNPLSNPFLIAAKGKGFLPMLARGWTIASRYGLNQEKMDDALGTLAAILRKYACSATLPVTASALASKPALAKKYSFQGIELAIHGLQHIDYSLLSLENQLTHLEQALDIFQKLGITATGFRCPYLRWNTNTLAALKELGFVYDSSQALAWDVVDGVGTDAYSRVLEFYRARSVREMPALPGWSEQLIRIPYCLPDDEALVDRLHIQDPAKMADIWLAMLDGAYQSGQLFTLGLHPERIHLCGEALQAVLAKARTFSPGVWIARLDEIASWYRKLAEATFEYQEGNETYHLKINAPAGATILVRSLEAMTVSQHWAQKYYSVSENEFTVQSDRRPWIGLSPDVPAALEQFLRGQGYLVEKSTEPQAYTCYLDHHSFSQQNEQSMLADLEREKTPLVRISRWPEGNRCGLVITGDVDALTVWDYATRILYR